MRRGAWLAIVVVLATATPGMALDHKNLDAGRPIRVADAYTIAAGELAIEAGAGLRLSRDDDARGIFPIELLWGLWPNLQVGVGSMLVTDPRSLDDRPRSGDLELSALYNFNQETLWLPAFALGAELTLPTGIGSSGAAIEVTGIVTRSFGRLSLHLNAGYSVLTDARRGERDGRYELVLGASYPIAAPRHTRTTLVADVFVEQSAHRGESETVGIELGVRHQLTPQLVWDVGVGTELAGPADRSRFTFSTGISFAF